MKSRSNEAVRRLIQDHRDVENLFRRYEQAAGVEQREELARQAIARLRLHSQLEDEIFYPAFRQATGEDLLVRRATDDHDDALTAIERLENLPARSPEFRAQFRKLAALILRHVREEEVHILPQALEAELGEGLAKALAERRVELEQELDTGGRYAGASAGFRRRRAGGRFLARDRALAS